MNTMAGRPKTEAVAHHYAVTNFHRRLVSFRWNSATSLCEWIQFQSERQRLRRTCRLTRSCVHTCGSMAPDMAVPRQGVRHNMPAGISKWSITGALRQASSASEVLSTVFSHEGALNAIHITAASTRLAALAPCSRQEEFEQLRQFMVLLGSYSTSLDARGVANVVWALGKLYNSYSGGGMRLAAVRSDCRMVVMALQPACLRHLDHFSTQHVSNIMWALAVLENTGQGKDRENQPESCLGRWDSKTLDLMLQAARLDLPGFTPQGISTLLWSCAKLGHPPGTDWLADFYKKTESELHSWPPQSISQSLWALAKLGSLSPPLAWVRGLCLQTKGSLLCYDPQSMANLTWALAVLLSASDLRILQTTKWMSALLKASELIMPNMSSQQLSNLLWAVEKLTHPISYSGAKNDAPMDPSSSSNGVPNSCLKVPVSFHQVASRCVLECLPSISEQGLACCSSSLSRMGFKPGRAWMSEWMLATAQLLREGGSSQAISICLSALLVWDDEHRDDPDADVKAWSPLEAVDELAKRADMDSEGTEASALLVALGAILRNGQEISKGGSTSANYRHVEQHNVDQQLTQASVLSVSQIRQPAAVPLGGISSNGSMPALISSSSRSISPGSLGALTIQRPTLPSQTHQDGFVQTVGSIMQPGPAMRNGHPFQLGTPPVLPITSDLAIQLDPGQHSLLEVISQSLAQHLQRHLPRYSPRQALTGLWSLAQAGHRPDAAWLLTDVVPWLDTECAGRIDGVVTSGALSDHEVAMYIWAKARWDLPVLSHVSLPHGLNTSLSDQDLAGTGKGESDRKTTSGEAQCLEEDSRGHIRQQNLPAGSILGPETLSTLMHAMGCAPAVYFSSDVSVEDRRRLLFVVGQIASSCRSMSGRNLATCLWALSQLRYRPGHLQQSQIWGSVMERITEPWCHPPGRSSADAYSSDASGSGRGKALSPSELILCLWALCSMRCPPDIRISEGLLKGLSRALISSSGGSSRATITSTDACRLLQAASAWRLALPHTLIQALISKPEPLGILGIPCLSGRHLVTALLHIGRLGCDLPQLWLSSAYHRAMDLVHQLNTPQLVALMEATSFLQIGVDHHDDINFDAGRELFLAALQEMECRGLSKAVSCSDDARLLRCLVAHRRQSRWLDAAGLDTTLTSFFIISRGRVASASTQQVLHMLHWLAHLDVSAIDEASEWLQACSETLNLRFRRMQSDELSYCLPALLRCGYRPTPSWVGVYLGIVLQRMPTLQQQQVCRVTDGLAKLDSRLHQRWVSKLMLSYGS